MENGYCWNFVRGRERECKREIEANVKNLKKSKLWKIDIDVKCCAFSIANPVERLQEKEFTITFKDHKPGL